jgi:hypothetical protein
LIALALAILQTAANSAFGWDEPATPALAYAAFVKEFYAAANRFTTAKTDQAREAETARIRSLATRQLELAEKNPRDPIAVDALVMSANQQLWMERNTSHPGWQENPLRKAIAILQRNHLQSEKLGTACWRLSYGFGQECEIFLRKVLETNPHREVQGAACLRLAQCLNSRRQTLELLQEQPEMAKRYEGLFGKPYLDALRGADRVKAAKEVEALFERAADQFPDVKLPYQATVGEQAKSELHEIRNLSVGCETQDIDGEDQDGKRFKLSDYRGKVVLLYFWSEY